MKTMDNGVRILVRALMGVSNILLIAMVLFIFEEVIARFLAGRGFGFLDEWSQWCLVWIVWLTVCVVLVLDKHIKVDAFLYLFPKRMQASLLIFRRFCDLLFFVFLLYCGIHLIRTLFASGTVSPTQVKTPLWIVNLVIPISASICIFITAGQLLKASGLLGKGSKKEE